MLAAAGVAALLSFAGCGEGGGALPTQWSPSAYPEAPEGVAGVVYVAPSLREGQSDGTPQSPYTRISDALAATEGAVAVLLAYGSYQETVPIERSGVRLVGWGGQDCEIQPPAGQPGVVVKGADDVSIESLGVRSAGGAGVRVEGAEVTLRHVQVKGVSLGSDGKGGHGVIATAGSKVEVYGGSFESCAGAGIMLSGSSGVITKNFISGAGASGIRVEESSDTVEVRENDLRANVQVGIAWLESRGIILNNLVAGTVAPEGSKVADGIHVARAGSDVRVEKNIVESNRRAGIFLSGEVVGIILNNLVNDNARVGIWLQQKAGAAEAVKVEANTVERNGFAGIGLTAEARGIILNNLVADTSPGTPAGAGEVEMGDGIGVLAGAWAEVKENEVKDSARAAILIDDADPTTVVEGNETGSGNAHGVVMQGVAFANTDNPAVPTPGEGSGSNPEGREDGLPTNSTAVEGL